MRLRLACLLLLSGALLSLDPAWGQGPRVALLDSANTRYFFGLHYANCLPPFSYTLGAEEYQRYFRGWEYVLQTNNIPYNLLHDSDIENGQLKNYDLLILSNNASLSDGQEKEIDQWVRKGGRLLATFGSGYKDIVQFDPREIDGLKLQKGGTGGLHQLWKDPLTKAFSSLVYSPSSDVRITQYSDITANLQGLLTNDVLPYGAQSNILVQRPERLDRMYGTAIIPGYNKTAPAILKADAAHGRVIYFAFAPEYLVSKEFNLPANPMLACDDGQNWAGRSALLRILMRDAINDLLNN